MPGRIRNAADSVAAAGSQVDNTAAWISVIVEKLNKIIDAVQKQQYLDLEVEIPLGDNLAHLFGKEHLSVDGKIPVLRANIKVIIPE